MSRAGEEQSEREDRRDRELGQGGVGGLGPPDDAIDRRRQPLDEVLRLRDPDL
jgi:hypothetical protein